MPSLQFTLRQLADFLHADLRGDFNCQIENIVPLDPGKKGGISFLENQSYKQYLATTAASAVIMRKADVDLAPVSVNVLIVPDPYVAYAKISALFVRVPCLPQGVHSTAVVGQNCKIDSSASIGANCVIGDNVVIGKNVEINAGCVVGNDVVIGDETRLYANVTLYYKTQIGVRGIVHSGVVVGADGFGMANEKGVWRKIHQLGRVVIGDDVEIGANTTIDRAALGETIIENGVKLDNQIQIGHNVIIGAHTAIAGCVGIAGSTKIGKHCMIGGGVGINGHIEIADGTIITARSAVHKSITVADIYASGIPAVPHRTWWRILKRLFQLDDIANRVKKLEKKCYE